MLNLDSKTDSTLEIAPGEIEEPLHAIEHLLEEFADFKAKKQTLKDIQAQIHKIDQAIHHSLN